MQIGNCVGKRHHFPSIISRSAARTRWRISAVPPGATAQVRIPQRFCSVWCHGSILPLDASRKPTTSFAPPVTGREHLRTSKSPPPSGDARPAYICPLHLGSLKFARNYNRSPCNARRRGRKPEKMRECFGAIPATDEGFIRRLYRTRPEVLRRVLMPLLTPQSAATRRLEEILAEEDNAELVRSNVEWLERFHDAVRDDALITEFGT